MSPALLDRVMWEINGVWLKRIPFFQDAERNFLTRVASFLSAYVYAPLEVPPPRRLYVIHRGCAKYKDQLLSVGDMWGHVEMMLTNAHQTTATAMTYLHVLYIESGKVLELAESYPEVRKRIRRWTAFEALKLYLISNLRQERRRQRRLRFSRQVACENSVTELSI
uniref:Cyclic nucleotide-binding domain-containing protein n=1 Tax=Chrysotila carterae TaxID=13221 RepID=A0A7S4BMY7_CHRCT